jgi:hypothetical protein
MAAAAVPDGLVDWALCEVIAPDGAAGSATLTVTEADPVLWPKVDEPL